MKFWYVNLRKDVDLPKGVAFRSCVALWKDVDLQNNADLPKCV